jgi:hypothetical protein
MNWWWMSFCDPNLPKGKKFLGALLIEATDEYDLIFRSHLFGLNPGGEIQFFKVPKMFEERIEPSMTYRLLTRAECEAIERKYNQ